jgi:alkanesulfonate monooxygenase SsuD/methylene tetrahydromethanopterin reductase-like flavin-dependent oxidoreductase (luciferase family)
MIAVRRLSGEGDAAVLAKTRTPRRRDSACMRIGIGLPAAVPGADMTTIGRWAAEAEAAGFDSVGAIDRLVYDNLDPLVALSAAAAATERIELVTTVLNVNWRANAPLLAKQLASVVRVSGGRLTAGLGMGGWPADYAASGVPRAGGGARFERSLAALSQGWEADGVRPRIVLAGTVPAAFARAARPLSDGWVAPLFGRALLDEGGALVRRAWAAAGRPGRPRIVTGRYVCLGRDAERHAREYIHHYYGAEYFELALADTATTPEGLRLELQRLAEGGVDDVLLYPCVGALEQVALLAEALASAPEWTARRTWEDPVRGSLARLPGVRTAA